MSRNGTRRNLLTWLVATVIPLLVALVTFAGNHREWFDGTEGVVVAPGTVATTTEPGTDMGVGV